MTFDLNVANFSEWKSVLSDWRTETNGFLASLCSGRPLERSSEIRKARHTRMIGLTPKDHIVIRESFKNWNNLMNVS